MPEGIASHGYPQFEADYNEIVKWCDECRVWLETNNEIFDYDDGKIIKGEHGLFRDVADDHLRAVYQLGQRFMVLRTQGLSYVLDRAKTEGGIKLPEKEFRKALDQLFDERTLTRLIDHLLAMWRLVETDPTNPKGHVPVRLTHLVRLIYPDSQPENSNRYRQQIKRHMLFPFTAMGIWHHLRTVDGYAIRTGDLLECFEERVFLPISTEMTKRTADRLR